MSLERHIIELAAKDTVSPALKNIATNADNAGRKAEDAGRRATRSTEDWSRAAKATGAALGAVGLLSSKIAGDAEASSARMSTAFSNVGLSVDDFHDKIKDLTGKGLKLAFDDEDVQDSLARLIATTGNAQKAFRDVAIAEDLARAQQISLAAATGIVNAAEAGRFRGLQQLGIQLDANATTEDAIAALQTRYAGNAEAYSKTTAASYERMANSAENYLETVGTFVNDHGQMALALGGIATAAGPAIDALKAVGSAAKTAGVAQKALSLAMGPAGLVAIAAAAGVALYELEKHWDAQELSTKEATDSVEKFNQSIGELAGGGSVDVATTKRLTDYSDAIQLVAQTVVKARKDLAEPFDVPLDPGATSAGYYQVDTAALQAHKDAIEANIISETEFNKALQEVNTIGLYNSALNADIVHKRMDELNQSLRDGTMTVDDYIFNVNYLNDNMQTYGLTIDQIANQQAALGQSTEQTAAQASFMATAYSASLPILDASTQALKDNTEAMEQNAAQAAAVATSYSASLPVITQYTGEAKAATGVTGELGRAFIDGSTAIDPFAQKLRDLNDELTDTGAEGLDRYMGMIVDYTNGIAGSTQKAQDWADALIAPRGTLSELDTLYNEGKIGLLDYVAAQVAQEQITGANARAQEAANVIQVKNASLIAAQADAAANYITKLSEMSGSEQELALAWADQDTAGRANDIATMASEYDSMTAAEQSSFEQMVTSAAATDPALAAILESLGLIKADVNDPTGWTLGMNVGGQSELDLMIQSLNDLTTILAQIFHIDLDHSEADDAREVTGQVLENLGTLNDTDASSSVSLPGIGGAIGDLGHVRDLLYEIDGSSAYASVYVTQYNNEVQVGGVGKALGGVIGSPTSYSDFDRAALGRMGRGLTLVGEHGPEMVSLPHGSLVTPNHATRYMDKGGGGDVVITGPITIVTNDPREFLRKTRELASSMERR